MNNYSDEIDNNSYDEEECEDLETIDSEMHMLKSIKIKNFRNTSQKFELNGLKKINLISGCNNSGKTCILNSITQEKIDTYFVMHNNFLCHTNKYLKVEKIICVDKDEYKEICSTISEFFGIISCYAPYNNDGYPNHFYYDGKKWQDLGQGYKRIFYIIVVIINSKDSIALIDGIENSIHYSIMPKVWTMIIELTRRYNCQLFATTNSREFPGYILDNKDLWNSCKDDFNLITLDYKDQKIVPSIYSGTDFESFILNDKSELKK